MDPIIRSCEQHSVARFEHTEVNHEQFTELEISVNDLAGTLSGMMGAMGIKGNASSATDVILENLSERLRFQADEVNKLGTACQKATTGALDTQGPAGDEHGEWVKAKAKKEGLEIELAAALPEMKPPLQAKILVEVETMKAAELEGGRIISQLDTSTSDAITLLPDFLPPSAAAAPPLEDAGVNGSGVGGTATASSTLSSSGVQNGSNGSVQAADSLGANASTSAIASQASGGRISASGVGEIGGHLGSGADVDPTVVSASSKTLGLNAASEFSSATSQQTLSATELTSLAHEGGAPATVSASSRASQLGAVVSPALMAAGLPKVLKASQVTGNLLSLRGATGGSSPISAQPAGRASLAPGRGSGATTMGARPASAGAGTRASSLGARSRTTAGARSASLKASGGTTAPRAAAASGRAASAQGSRVLSPRTPAQGAAGKAVGRAGSQGVSARGASGTTQARGALGRAQRAFGLGRAASNKKKDDPKATEHLGEQLLTTDSRLSFLGRGQREDPAKRDIASDSE